MREYWPHGSSVNRMVICLLLQVQVSRSKMGSCSMRFQRNLHNQRIATVPCPQHCQHCLSTARNHGQQGWTSSCLAPPLAQLHQRSDGSTQWHSLGASRCVCFSFLSRVPLSCNPMDCGHRAPLCPLAPREESWSGLWGFPFSIQDLLRSGIQPRLLHGRYILYHWDTWGSQNSCVTSQGKVKISTENNSRRRKYSIIQNDNQWNSAQKKKKFVWNT